MKTTARKTIKRYGIAVVILLSILVALTFFTNKTVAFAMGNAFVSNGNTLAELNTETENDFSPNEVIVVLTEEETRQFHTYTPQDFPEIDCVAVNDLTSFTVDHVREKVNGESTSEKMLVDTDRFRRILSLELEEKGKENVLSVISRLEQRQDIISAEPNAKMELFSSLTILNIQATDNGLYRKYAPHGLGIFRREQTR